MIILSFIFGQMRKSSAQDAYVNNIEMNRSVIVWGYEELLVPLPKERFIFNTITTAPTRSLPRNKFSFQNSLSINTLSSNLLLNSLSYGLAEGLEIGTVPLFYSIPGSIVNGETKLNFLRSRRWDMSAGFSIFALEQNFNVPTSYTYFNVEMPVTYSYYFLSYALLSTARPDTFKKFQFNFMLKVNCLRAEPTLNTTNQKLPEVYQCNPEGSIDTQYSFNNNYWMTMGLASMQEEPFNVIDSKQVMAIGLSVSNFRSKRLISRPSLGVLYIPEANKGQLVFTTTFNEL